MYQLNVDACCSGIQGIFHQLFHNIQDRSDDLGAGKEPHRVRRQLLHDLRSLSKEKDTNLEANNCDDCFIYFSNFKSQTFAGQSFLNIMFCRFCLSERNLLKRL